jgi:hypothetical protein
MGRVPVERGQWPWPIPKEAHFPAATVARVGLWGIATAALLVVAGCTGPSGDATEAGTPAAFCPAIVEVAAEMAVASAEVGDELGPNSINRPEFATARAAVESFFNAAPADINDKLLAAGYHPELGEEPD